MQIEINSAQEMEAFGYRLGAYCPVAAKLYLQGDLGTGKTTLVRGFLRGRGYPGKVKSPSYTLIEAYQLAGVDIYHFDLYRLNDAEELESIGFRDYFDGNSITLVEWPEKAESVLIEPDLKLIIDIVSSGRRLTLQANNPLGKKIIDDIQ